jgi:hypothetical protein
LPNWKNKDGKPVCQQCIIESMRRGLIATNNLLQENNTSTRDVLVTVAEWMKEDANGNGREVE